MTNKKMLSMFALGVVALLGVGFVAAYQGDYSVTGPNYSEERHEAMGLVFENLDYNAWVELMTEDGRHPRIVEFVTEENFETFVEAHEARIAGDFEKMLQLRTELGFNNGMSPRDGTSFGGKGMRQGSGMKVQGNCPNLE